MLSRSLATVTLFGLLWLSPVQPTQPDSEDGLPSYWPPSPSDFGLNGGALDSSSQNDIFGSGNGVNANDVDSQSMDGASAEETDDADVSMGEGDTKVEMDMDVDGSADAEKYRLRKAFEGYTLFIKNAIKRLRDLDDKSIDVEGYMGMRTIPSQADWRESQSITLLLVYWNTYDNRFDFHVTKLPYNEIFGIDYKAICINGMRPALTRAFGTSILDSSALEELAKPKVARINAHLDEDSKPKLSDLGTRVKAYQGDNLVEICTDRVTRYSVRTGKMESVSLAYNPKQAFSRQIRKEKQIRESSSPITALVNAPRYRRLRNALQHYKLYLNSVLSHIQAIQDGSLDPRWYVFPISPRPEVSKYSHEKGGFYLVYWDLELNRFDYRMATHDEITAYKDGNSVKLFNLMKSVCVMGRHYPANIPWEGFAKYMDAYFQWIEEKLPAGWKGRLMRLRDAWKAK
ncbi:hypothetical protein H4R35_000685 [Dimargaris xerosporica]|nr:hypothetical protein H4R35_000685 [Dimargaris xerosporica]